MHRFWFQLDTDRIGFSYGAGVTAFDELDARALLKAAMAVEPPILSVIADVDISTLDSGHVLPNTLPPDGAACGSPSVIGARSRTSGGIAHVCGDRGIARHA